MPGEGQGYDGFFFPKQVYLWGSILEKKWLDTLVGALGRVGRGFGSAGRAELCWGVGFGRAGRAGLGWARLLWVYFGLIDLLALFGVDAGIIMMFFSHPKKKIPVESKKAGQKSV